MNASWCKDWLPRHKDPNKVVICVPDWNYPLIAYNFYAQIDDDAKYWVTPTMGVYYLVKQNFPFNFLQTLILMVIPP